MEMVEKAVAKSLMDIKAVMLRPDQPFTWASGWKSPIYCDNRLTLSYPEIRKVVENGLVEVIKTYFPTCEVVMGTSTAGIAHAAYVSDILDLPMGYVRGGSKDHGRGNQIEGVEKTYAMQAGRELRVVVKPDQIDDLSSYKVAREIKDKIEETMQYPGTIKVVVIRETRAEEVAK